MLNLGTTPSISVLEALVHVSSLSALATLENVLMPVEFEDALISVSVVILPDEAPRLFRQSDRAVE